MKTIERVYLAARFGRREEIEFLSKDLEKRGIVVTSLWLTRSAVDAIQGIARSPFAERCAREDFEHIEDSDMLIVFTDTDAAYPSKGGMHTEVGYALALGMPVWLVGPRLNVFHHLPDIEQFDDWGQALNVLDTLNSPFVREPAA